MADPHPSDASPVPSGRDGRPPTGKTTLVPPPDAQAARRTRPPLAAVAAVVVVALLAGVLATLGRGLAPRGPGGASTGLPTTSSTPATPTTIARNLVERSPITGQPGTPVVAPSDPRVVYEYADNDPGAIVLRRSDDGGASWQDLAYPGGGFVGAVELAVNPADARNIFLRLVVGYQQGGPSPCPPPLASARATPAAATAALLRETLPGSGGPECTNVYASQDGGTGWTLVRLPVAGSLFQTGVTFTYDATSLQAQRGVLFGRVWQLDASGAQTGDIRIVGTGDEGLTWHAADEAVAGKAPHICAFSATPQGSTLFAITSTAGCWDWTHGTRSVWRSDDAGAHWARSGGLPTALAQPGVILIAASRGTADDAASAALYALPGAAGMRGVADIQESTDGGQTWAGAPDAGLPAGAIPLLAAQTPLSDGSLVVAVGARADAAGGTPPATTPGGPYGTNIGSVACYRWAVGAATWQVLTPAATLGGTYIANVYVSTAEQEPAVTLSLNDDFLTSDPTYTLVPFTAGG